MIFFDKIISLSKISLNSSHHILEYTDFVDFLIVLKKLTINDDTFVLFLMISELLGLHKWKTTANFINLSEYQAPFKIIFWLQRLIAIMAVYK